jgi:hypothetical protein
VPATDAEQVETPGAPGASVQEAAGVNVSEADEERLTVPEGLDFAPEGSVSVTVTETVPAAPAPSGFGLTETELAVERLLTCRIRLVVLDWKTPGTPG